MKHLINMVICLSLLTSCSVTNRIVATDDSQMKTYRLVQLPEAKLVSKAGNLDPSADLKVSAIHLCEEVKDLRPQVSVSFHVKEPTDYHLSESLIVIQLDNEDIELNSLNLSAQLVKDSISLVSEVDTLSANVPVHNDTTTHSQSGRVKQSFVIPENLWVSIIHTNIIKYKIINANDLIEIVLNQSEKSMLDKFLGMAIRDRDAKFPAIPEGQKKW